MGRTTDLLYPLKPLEKAELMMRAEVMLNELNAWEANLPLFLRPSQQTLTGQRIFESELQFFFLHLSSVSMSLLA